MLPLALARRILICCHDFSPGGTERVAIDLAARWAGAGRDVTILVGCAEGELAGVIDPRVRVVALAPPIRRSLIARYALGKAMAARLSALAPDVVFLPGNYHLPLCVPFAAMRRREGLWFKIALKLSNPITPHGLTAPLLRALIRRYQTAIDGVAAMNSGLARDLAALVPGVGARTLFDPVNLESNPPPIPATDRDERFHLLWAGRLEPQKDALLALRVVRALLPRLPLRLTLLGEGRQRRMLDQAIAAMGLTGVVSAPGHVPGIDRWLARADALLVTSRYEGGPAVAIEALAHGVPVVSTDCSHLLHDIMTLPEAGHIVPTRSPEALAEAVLAIARTPAPDPARLAGLVAHLEPAECAAAYLAWFDDLVRS